jgi:hypothetical protein
MKIIKLEGRFANKPGGYAVRNKVAARDRDWETNRF